MEALSKRLRDYLVWLQSALPAFKTSRYRRPVDLYGLIGALDYVTHEGTALPKLRVSNVGQALEIFAASVGAKEPSGDPGRYLIAASRQTDNIKPRQTRIDCLVKVIREA